MAPTSDHPSRGTRIVVLSLGALLLIAAIILYLKVVQPVLAPKRTIIFEPNQVLIGTTPVSPDLLQETARIMAQRWSLLGYKSPLVSFKTNASGQIVARIPTGVSDDFINKLKVNGVLEFVDFGGKSMPPGTRVNTDYTYGFLTGEGTEWHTLMTGGQIQTISVYQNPAGTYEIPFSLNETGRKTLSDYTSQHVDSYLGFVLDKVVVACPRIAAPITDGAGVINGNFTRQDAQIFVAIIRSGPLPIPLK